MSVISEMERLDRTLEVLDGVSRHLTNITDRLNGSGAEELVGSNTTSSALVATLADKITALNVLVDRCNCNAILIDDLLFTPAAPIAESTNK